LVYGLEPSENKCKKEGSSGRYVKWSKNYVRWSNSTQVGVIQKGEIRRVY